MISTDLNNLANELSAMSSDVDAEIWAKLGIMRANLHDLATQVHQLEAHCTPHAQEEEGGEHAHA